MKLKRLVAGVLSAAMMLSIGSTLAFASTATDSTIEFETTLNLSTDGQIIPDVTYTYTLTPVNSVSKVTLDDSSSVSVSVGTTTLEDDGSVSFSNSDTLELSTEETDLFNDVTKTVSWEIDPATDLDLTEPGFYVYTLTQDIDDDDLDNSSLYTTDNTTAYVYLQVSYDDSGDLEISEYLIYDDDDVDEDNKFAGFVNYYGVDEDGKPTTLTFQVTGYKFGSLASSAKDFQYVVTVVGATEGDAFTVSDNGTAKTLYADEDGVLCTVVDGTDGGDDTYTAYEFNLAEGDTLSVKAVTEDMSFTVNVYDEDNDGYTAASRTYTSTKDGTWADLEDDDSNVLTITSAAAVEVKYSMDPDDESTIQGIDFAGIRGNILDDEPQELEDNVISLPETGVILEFAPFALMVLAAGAFISLRFVRATRKNEE